jgi:hypothetical protein
LQAGIPAAAVAEARPPGEGICLDVEGRLTPFEPPERDEVARLLDGIAELDHSALH